MPQRLFHGFMAVDVGGWGLKRRKAMTGPPSLSDPLCLGLGEQPFVFYWSWTMTKYYFDYFTKHVSFVGIEAESEREATELFRQAMLDWSFVSERRELTESQEYCDSWWEYVGPNDDPDYGDADLTDHARRVIGHAKEAQGKGASGA